MTELTTIITSTTTVPKLFFTVNADGRLAYQKEAAQTWTFVSDGLPEGTFSLYIAAQTTCAIKFTYDGASYALSSNSGFVLHLTNGVKFEIDTPDTHYVGYINVSDGGHDPELTSKPSNPIDSNPLMVTRVETIHTSTTIKVGTPIATPTIRTRT